MTDTPQPPTTADWQWLDEILTAQLAHFMNIKVGYPSNPSMQLKAYGEMKQAIEAHIKELLDEAKHCRGCGKYVSYCDECQRLWQT